MSRLLRSTAIGLALAIVAPAMKAPDVFVYRSAQAQGYVNGVPVPQVMPDGSPIPAWIKSSCCGPKDVHRLTMGAVHGPMPLREAYAELGAHNGNTSDSLAYTVDGYLSPVDVTKVQQSQDGYVWAFYRQDDDGSQSGMYCLFLPMAF